MGRKIVVIICSIALVALFGYSVYTARRDGIGQAGSVASQSAQVKDKETAEKSTAEGGDAKGGDAAGEEGGKSSAGKGTGSGKSAEGGEAGKGAESGESGESGASGKQEGEKDTSKTDGWEPQKDGSYEKGDVSADVVRYGKTTLEEGEELIEQLAKGGLQKAKKLSADKSENSVVYKYSGTRLGQEEAEFIKFEFIIEKGTGYLVTVIAANEADMDADIAYLTDNLAKVAK